ncbi:MAG: ABC-2 type transport system ATP-binding protein [Chlamydiales bacterium]|jgi:ABC-2 type transport system ATP-binding protein
MIEIRNLSKHFGPFRAVDDITFKVERGEVLGFLGPNGAGKSTTMKMVAGFLAPTSGTAIVCGHDVTADPMSVKAAIGYLPEGAPLYPDMTPRALLAFAADLRGLGATKQARIDDVVERVQLAGVMNQRIETLSKGFKRRVGLALAILHDPDVLVLDEPTDGLDPNQKHEVRKLIRDMAPGKVIVLSTHILEEVESVCTRAIIISQGKLCFDGTPETLRKRSSYHNALSLSLKTSTAPGAGDALAGLGGVARVAIEGESDGLTHYTLFPEASASILREVSDHVYGQGWEVEHLHVNPGRLDDVFRDITTGSATGAKVS